MLLSEGPRRAGLQLTMRRFIVSTTCAVLVAACSIGEQNHETVVVKRRARSEIRTCDSPFVKPDLASLPACGAEQGAPGRCFDGAKTSLVGLPACSGADVCVPEKVLQANGEKLKACKFFIDDKPGVCLSVLVSDVAAHKNELQKDVCDENERCVPCINPISNEDTHICDPMGVHEQACAGGAGAEVEPCCHGAGVCMNEDAAPPDQRGQLSREACPAKKVCAPAVLVDGTPVKCEVASFSGVCIDVCFASMLKGAGNVLRAGCGPTEVCLPCAVGKSQGVPGCD